MCKVKGGNPAHQAQPQFGNQSISPGQLMLILRMMMQVLQGGACGSCCGMGPNGMSPCFGGNPGFGGRAPGFPPGGFPSNGFGFPPFGGSGFPPNGLGGGGISVHFRMAVGGFLGA
ncbi:MAG: hypothetical protein HY319_13810 [Armatimonadetes bacterium]|nr:hypothetical protein [Armatimonadota bacterium]